MTDYIVHIRSRHRDARNVREALASALGPDYTVLSLSSEREHGASAIEIIARAVLGDQARIDEDPHVVTVTCACGEGVAFNAHAVTPRAAADALISHGLTCERSATGRQATEIARVMSELVGVVRRRSMKGGSGR